MYRDKEKLKKKRPISRPSALQQYKEEIGDDVLPEATLTILQQKYGISKAEVSWSEKNNLIDTEEGTNVRTGRIRTRV